MYVSCDDKGIIMAVSDRPVTIKGLGTHNVPDQPRERWSGMIGKPLVPKGRKDRADLRVAFMCNWNDPCGISTYSKLLVDAIRPKVKEVAIFSEVVDNQTAEDEPFVTRCWKRGESMKDAVAKVLAWKPDFVIIQHEFGIFPKATFFLQMLHMLERTPYAITVHSVYEHLDKSVCTSAIKNIIVHSDEGKKILKKLGNNSKTWVIPHGCIRMDDRSELWNIFQTPYSLVQFGFGFFYKGVDVVLEAVHHLKVTQPEKYKDIFYLYLCSDNTHTTHIHSQYYNFLTKKIEDLDLRDNVAIIRKYQTDQAINNYLRTAKVALFPYVMNPNNTVFGASGAIRVAMANGIPVVASNSHQFDDLEGVVPRPEGPKQLAHEIDLIFSSDEHKQALLKRISDYIDANTWPVTADRYLDVYEQII